MHSAPVDLRESAILAALSDHWSLRAVALDYRALGFGSHHWEAVDDGGGRWFVTVDDLRDRRLDAAESFDEGYLRLRTALTVAATLADSRDFVVAPARADDGEPVIRLTDAFALALYPFVDGERFGWGTYTSDHRAAILELVLGVHSAPAPVRHLARTDDFAIQCRDQIELSLDGPPADAASGPYTQRAADLVSLRATAVRRSLATYDTLVAGLRTDPPELVLTHGEPHPGNTMRRNGIWLLIDWDTVLLAPPERDLWDLDPGDGSIHAAYTEASGRTLRPDIMRLYRLRWSLTDAAMSLARFRVPHGGSADDDECWTILQETLAGLAEDAT